MAERNVPIVLTALDVQRVLRAVLDRDGAEAFDILEKVVKPQVDKALAPSHCRPVFELVEGQSVIGPPPPGPPTGKDPRDA
jgi:hypothetical protein